MEIRPFLLLLPALLPPALLGLGGCAQTEVSPADTLPAPTRDGRNTAGCRADGLLWTAGTDAMFGPRPTIADWCKDPRRPGRHALSLLFTKAYEISTGGPQARTGIAFSLPDVPGPGTYALGEPSSFPFNPLRETAHASFVFHYPLPGRELLTGNVAPGRLTITRLDTLAHVICGTYGFTARSVDGPPPPVLVGEGRFDCKR